MSKIVRDTHITGMKGVNLFEKYCLNHHPVIIFRETLKSDFGIDAELEMTEITEDEKTQPTGETIKIQIKTGSSYIRNEKATQFEYYASESDIEYWSKYKGHGFEVLLVIVDPDNEKIYCKKVFDLDLGIAKTNQKKNKSFPITFSKEENLLQVGEHDFRERFSDTFRNRVNYGVKETLVSNLLKFQKCPRVMHSYRSNFKDKKEIIKFIREKGELEFKECPYYVSYGETIFTFNSLGPEFGKFKTLVLKHANSSIITYQEILDNKILRNHYIELLNEYIRDKLKEKRIVYNRKYKRYYFGFNPEKDTLPMTVKTKTRIRQDDSEKKVVTWHEYGTKYKFYRHLAFGLQFQFIENEIYVALGHKYLFTIDGWKTLPPLEITKFTNFLTARDFNDKYYNWLHFWWTLFSKDNDVWDVFDYKDVTIKIQTFYSEEVNFGIPLENKVPKTLLRTRIKKLPYQNSNQLFTDED